MALSKFKNIVLPFLTFNVLAALAFYFIIVHTELNGLGSKLKSQCQPVLLGGTPPYLLPYTGVVSIDDTLCVLVSCFHSSFGEKEIPFVIYFLASATPVMGHIYFESWRKSRSFLLAFPVIFGMALQVASFGAIISVYWMLFMVSGAAQLSSAGQTTMVTKAHAQAVLFGVFIGMIILSGSMVILQDPYVTAIWQIFPIFTSVAQLIHLLVRPASQHSDSGFGAIRAFYILSFILISSMHVAYAAGKNAEELKAFFVPSVAVLPSTTPIELQVLNLLQWDLAFGLFSSLVATLWFAKSATQLLALLAWSLLATPLVGPGAAFSAVALWRESRLHTAPIDAKTVKSE